MNKKYFLPIIVLLLFAAAVTAIPVSFTVKASGVQETITQNQAEVQNCTINPETNATECIPQIITTNSTSTKSWSDSVSIDLECGAVCAYPMPSFDVPADVVIEKYTVKTDSEAMAVFESTKTQTTNDSYDKIRVEVAKKSNQIVVDRISPSTIKEGTSQINIFARNNGSSTVDYFNVSIIGAGFMEAFAESSDTLEPGELGIIPVIVNSTGAGQKEAIIKVSWSDSGKSLSAIYVTNINILAGEKPGVQVNSTQITERFNSDKEALRSYESEYNIKKSQGYLVSEIYDSIKNARDYVASIQLLVEEEKFAEAKIKLPLLELSLEDIKNGLQNALKTQQTFLDKLKSNALLISTIVAAVAGLIGLYERQRMKIKSIKEKLAKRKMEKEKPQAAPKKKLKKPKAKKPEEFPMPEIGMPS